MQGERNETIPATKARPSGTVTRSPMAVPLRLRHRLRQEPVDRRPQRGLGKQAFDAVADPAAPVDQERARKRADLTEGPTSLQPRHRHRERDVSLFEECTDRL